MEKRITFWAHYALLIEALALFAISVVATHFASRYAEIRASNHVEDLILSNTPVFNFEFVFVELAVALVLFVVVLCIKYSKGSPFIIKAVSLFILIRAGFVSLTHMGPFPTRLDIESNLLDFITSGNDLFFSGHTGLPFLIALIFWNHKYLRTLFVSAAGVFGAIVLLAHLHYSIDVFAAFFITYAIYHISLKLFKRDYHHFVLEQRSIIKRKSTTLALFLMRGSKKIRSSTKKS
ncbi:MAG: hypothetical protein QG653_632 [Patescibacteria group bacterium]|nr:hypothetical protein [Patescibacteria group bacterium]